jgi:Uma2 family endonuclease
MATKTLGTTRKLASAVPLLYPGDHLDQPEFHRRYEAYPDAKVKFELIGGIVYMMCPAGYDHGRGDYKFTGLIFQYERKTPGIEGAKERAAAG